MDFERFLAWLIGIVVLILMLGVWAAQDVDAKTIRSRAPLIEFRKANVCPATGKFEVYTPCLGYVIDHVMPLCAMGVDEPRNMQWQELVASKKKDLLELEVCTKLRKKGLVLP